MFFNSIDFALFLPVVFILYWFIFHHNLRVQNFFIVVASFIFYGWWDWRFLFLLLFSSLVDYSVGRALLVQEHPVKRKLLLWISILVNFSLLGFFKYFNFFAHNFARAFTFFGHPIEESTLHIILPVGISFYTFQTVSYGIDVYRRRLEPTKDLIAFLAFVSFFPQLVAGPIERATHLLPQFYHKRTFDYAKAVDGLRQMLWGLFKKIVIADNCAEYANLIFNNSEHYSGGTLIVGALFFTFQIYCDFSGYSDIAIGCSRLFGFDLMRNFAYPYFSRDIAEFWRRWHISLSTWFRDYLYIPLGGSKGGTWMKIRNTFIIFLVSGFWHGASWTFIAWGALNAFYFLPLLLLNKNRSNLNTVAQGRQWPTIQELSQVVLTFCLTAFAWIFFRAESMNHAVQYISQLVSGPLFRTQVMIPAAIVVLLLIFFLLEWRGREHPYAIAAIGLQWPRVMRYGFYYVIIITIFLMNGKEQQFIYFQF